VFRLRQRFLESIRQHVYRADRHNCESLRVHEFSTVVVFDVNVLRSVRSQRIVGEFYGSLVVAVQVVWLRVLFFPLFFFLLGGLHCVFV
jgi:hypothetical protein